jgi:hypothetical protein
MKGSSDWSSHALLWQSRVIFARASRLVPWIAALLAFVALDAHDHAIALEVPVLAAPAPGSSIPRSATSSAPSVTRGGNYSIEHRTNLPNLIKSIPEGFWGVAAGSIFTLLGVWLTNLGHARRQREQLSHDSKMKAMDREFAVRRDVYLGAAEAVAAGFQVLSRFSDPNLDHDVLMQNYMEKAPAMSKVHVVAQENTVSAFMTYGAALAGAFLRLSILRANLMQKKQEVAVMQSRVDAYLKDQAQALELIHEQLLNPIRDDRRWNLLNERAEHASERVTQSLQEKARLSEELARELSFPSNFAFQR